MFKDIRQDINKIKVGLKERALFNSHITLKTKQILSEIFGEKASFYISGIYPKKNELIIEVTNNILANEIQLNLGLIREKIGDNFEKISIRIV